MSSMSTRTTGSYGEIYPYKNDPRRAKRSLYVTNVNTYTGGYMPVLYDQNYTERKTNTIHSYDYDDKVHRGARPMHQSTFEMNYQKRKDNFVTNNMRTYRGNQLKPENVPNPARDQFRHQFELGFNDKRRFQTDYESNFYPKNQNNTFQYQEEKRLTDERILQNRKSEGIAQDKNEPSYWTQYKRTHDYLGQLRGPGEPRQYPDRQESEKPEWSMNENFKRVSGNVILQDLRNNHNESILN